MRTSSRRIAALLLVPLALVLSACRIDATVNVSDGRAGSLDVIATDTDGTYSGSHMTCADIAELFNTEALGNSDITVEDIPNGDTLTCRIRNTDSFVIYVPIDNGDGTFTIEQPMSDARPSFAHRETSLTFNLPGKPIEVSGDGKIVGNSVVYDSMAPLEQGFRIVYEGDAAAGPSPSTSPTPTFEPEPYESHTTDPALPLTAGGEHNDKRAEHRPNMVRHSLIGAAIGGGGALLVGGVATLVRNHRKKRNASQYGQSQQFGQQPFGYSAQQFGQSQQFGQQAYETPSVPTTAMPGQQPFGHQRQLGQPTEQLPTTEDSPSGQQ